MRIPMLVVGALLMLAAPVRAQTVEVPVGVDIEFFAAGVSTTTGTPLMAPQNFLLANALCNQTKVAVPGSVTNPTIIAIDDPADPATPPTRECILGPGTSGVLVSVPIGAGIRATAAMIGDRGGRSARSAPSNPFDRAVVYLPPAAAKGIRIR